MSNHQEIMIQLKQELLSVKDVIGGGGVSYLDIPLHANTGDQLIYQGTLKFLKDNKIKIQNISTAHNKPRKYNSEIIILHGGGNFGDLYRLHQNYREEIVKLNPDKKIVILPQTIYFENLAEQEKSAAIFIEHRNVHLYVRDRRSLEIAKKFTDKAYIMPDMAHWLYGSMVKKNIQKYQLLTIRRQDVEKGGHKQDESEDLNPYDWGTMLPLPLLKVVNIYVKLSRKILKVLPFDLTSKIVINIWKILSKLMINKTVETYNRYDSISTDRLHGHILSMLLDKNNIVIDNSYGKNYAYTALWTETSPLCSTDTNI